MYPRLVSFGMTQSGLSSHVMQSMESLLGRADNVHVLISDESSAAQLAHQFHKKYGAERLEGAQGIVHFVNAFEPGHVYGAIKQMVEAYPDKEVNIYLDIPSLTNIRPVANDAQVVLMDQAVTADLEILLVANPNVVVRIATLRVAPHKMVDFARSVGSLKRGA
uniref:Uncharacterized protein n=1 Tax=Pseudomonas phage HRDY3 TaxID=3236930 RepID=A0AB39CDP4_9VIRU